LNTYAVAAMQEKGIDISGQHAKALDEELARRMDVVVTVCGNAAERCPILPSGVKRLHWPLEDPAAVTGSAAEILARFREVRDQIEERTKELMQGLFDSSSVA
jgi:arsenate reductase